jgi:RsiW-degrading membrane proteinase PrsW (M82 family)/CRP-like cAMP-binding protein
MNAADLIAYVIAVAVPLGAIALVINFDLFQGSKRNPIICGIWGALGAFFIAYIVNQQVYNIVGDAVIVITLTAPIVEEIAKSLILVYFVTSPSFRYSVDGAIYGFACGIGFAMMENIFYIGQHTGGASSLGIAVSRVLSASLMHATASAIVGITLGALRRSHGAWRGLWSTVGLLLAIGLHMLFNNALQSLQESSPLLLLLVAVGIGVGGMAIIILTINRSLADEKKHFEHVLNANVGVSKREARAVQQIGEGALETVLTEMKKQFGEDIALKMQRLLLIQANIGILENNLKTDAGPRLRKAWQDEVAKLRKESDKLRLDIGVTPMQYMRSVFPSNDPKFADLFNKVVAKQDPTAIHSFDLYMVTAAKVGTNTPEELAEMADTLKANTLFANVDVADLENLSRSIKRSRFSEGQVIFNEGAPGDALYLVTSGEIKLFVQVDGIDTLLRTIRAGEVIGDLALLDGQPRSAKAVAMGAVEALMVAREQFNQFMSSRPQVILAILKFLAERIKHATDVVENRISWAAEVAQGNYKQAEWIDTLIPASAMPHGDVVSPVTAPAPAAKRPGALTISGATMGSVQVGGAFSSLTTMLAQREKELGKKIEESGVSLTDIADLPADQKAIMSLLLKDPIAATQGMSIDQIQKNVPEVANIPEVLAALTKATWLIQMGVEPRLRYKINLARKRGRAIPKPITS